MNMSDGSCYVAATRIYFCPVNRKTNLIWSVKYWILKTFSPKLEIICLASTDSTVKQNSKFISCGVFDCLLVPQQFREE
jgi:hypothetical protein